MNFPIKKTKTTKFNNQANRGMGLEEMVNQSNTYYLNMDKAVIYKKPTPVQIVHVDYPMRSKAVITEAYYKIPSTTDYNGVYKGYYIDFECKENHNKTIFPLRNIHPHQIKHLINIEKHRGIGFLIVYWAHQNEYYLLTIKTLTKFIDENERKSIPYEVFKKEGILIKEGYLPRLDYLAAVDLLLGC